MSIMDGKVAKVGWEWYQPTTLHITNNDYYDNNHNNDDDNDDNKNNNRQDQSSYGIALLGMQRKNTKPLDRHHRSRLIWFLI